MVEYWHWSSLHYGQETYWRGILSHDLQPNRVYGEMTQTAQELKRIGPQLVNLKKENAVAILFSTDSANAISYMPFSDRVNYTTVMTQLWNALYDLNAEPDFLRAGDPIPPRYKVVLVPPLYSASDKVLGQIAEYVKAGGHVVMCFKSGFTNEHSTVRHEMAPGGPLRAAAGFHYQEFTTLAEPVALTPDPFRAGAGNQASVWAEFLIPDTAEVLASLDGEVWKYPAITRNRFGGGTLTYEATAVTDELQRAIVADALRRAGIGTPDAALPAAVRVRHGRNSQGRAVHYYFNFSGSDASFPYAGGAANDVLTGKALQKGASVTLKPWEVIIAAER
jgi:beta-galactosidase